MDSPSDKVVKANEKHNRNVNDYKIIQFPKEIETENIGMKGIDCKRVFSLEMHFKFFFSFILVSLRF